MGILRQPHFLFKRCVLRSNLIFELAYLLIYVLFPRKFLQYLILFHISLFLSLVTVSKLPSQCCFDFLIQVIELVSNFLSQALSIFDQALLRNLKVIYLTFLLYLKMESLHVHANLRALFWEIYVFSNFWFLFLVIVIWIEQINYFSFLFGISFLTI